MVDEVVEEFGVRCARWMYCTVRHGGTRCGVAGFGFMELHKVMEPGHRDLAAAQRGVSLSVLDRGAQYEKLALG